MTGAADTRAGEDGAAVARTIVIHDSGWGKDYGLTKDRWGGSAWDWRRNGRICLRERRGRCCLRRGKDRWHPLEEEGAALNQRA